MPRILSRDGKPYGLAGRIAGRGCAVYREGGRVIFRAGRGQWPLSEVRIEHRDEEGRIAFRVMRGEAEELRARYRRRGPSAFQLLFDFADFTADEPWSWEDSDFGLFVFHVATETGPIKYRHALFPLEDNPDETAPREYADRFEIDDRGIVRHLRSQGLAPREYVEWDDLVETRAKFEVAGIWADKSILVLRAAASQCVVPVHVDGSLPPGLTDALTRLPGFDDEAHAALRDACEYAASDAWPNPIQRSSRAERPVWRRPPEDRPPRSAGKGV